MRLFFTVLFFIASAHSHSETIDSRYCGEPDRYESGKIKRDKVALRKFEDLYPLPSNYDRKEWQIDHVIPLAVGGCDDIHNLQWLPKIIKTCANSGCKDRWERIIYKRSN